MHRFPGSKLHAKGKHIFVVHILKAINGREEDGEKYRFHLRFAETSRQYGVTGMPKIIVPYIYAWTITNMFVGRASEKLIRKFQDVHGQNCAKGKAEHLMVMITWLLSGNDTDREKTVTKEQVVAAAKLYYELREGPLKSLKEKADYFEKAEKFLRSEDGVNWSK